MVEILYHMKIDFLNIPIKILIFISRVYNYYTYQDSVKNIFHKMSIR